MESIESRFLGHDLSMDHLRLFESRATTARSLNKFNRHIDDVHVVGGNYKRHFLTKANNQCS